MFHGAIDNYIGTAVVNLEGRGWLEMAHIGEDGTDDGTVFGILKGSTKFSFAGRIDNHPHYGVDDMNGVIHGR